MHSCPRLLQPSASSSPLVPTMIKDRLCNPLPTPSLPPTDGLLARPMTRGRTPKTRHCKSSRAFECRRPAFPNVVPRDAHALVESSTGRPVILRRRFNEYLPSNTCEHDGLLFLLLPGPNLTRPEA